MSGKAEAAVIDRPAAGVSFRGQIDEARFAQLYVRHFRVVFATALSILKSVEDAEDVTQEVFAKMARKMDSGFRPDNFEAWLTRSARNCAIDHLRARRQTVAIKEQDESRHEHSIQQKLEQRQEVKAVLKNLGTLPEKQRTALLLYELAGSSYSDIAKTLDMTPGAIGDLIKRARIALRICRAGEELGCADVRERLAGDLDRRRVKKELRIHLDSCSSCQRFDRGLKADRKVLRGLLPALPFFLHSQDASATENASSSKLSDHFGKSSWARYAALSLVCGTTVFFLHLGDLFDGEHRSSLADKASGEVALSLPSFTAVPGVVAARDSKDIHEILSTDKGSQQTGSLSPAVLSKSAAGKVEYPAFPSQDNSLPRRPIGQSSGDSVVEHHSSGQPHGYSSGPVEATSNSVSSPTKNEASSSVTQHGTTKYVLPENSGSGPETSSEAVPSGTSDGGQTASPSGTYSGAGTISGTGTPQTTGGSKSGGGQTTQSKPSDPPSNTYTGPPSGTTTTTGTSKKTG